MRHRAITDATQQSYWVASPGDPVMTRERLRGVVKDVQQGPEGGNETYIVTLDGGMGGGEYGRNEISKISAVVEHTAADDYPVLAEILTERSPLVDVQHLTTGGLRITCSACGFDGASPSANACPRCGTHVVTGMSRTAAVEPELQTEANFGDRVLNWIGNDMAKADPSGQYTNWCRFRRDKGQGPRCWYAKDYDHERSKQVGYAVWIPEDRGACPRNTWDQQKACPISEPGPNVPGGLTDATIPYEMGGQRGTPGAPYRANMPVAQSARHDLDFVFHFTAAWKDVRAKATRIVREGHVRILSSPGNHDNGLIITAEVQGDTNVYQTSISRVPGRYAVAMWECGCAWAAYAWGRTGRWRRYEGRMCSHALALTYEAQKREMFGKPITNDRFAPSWRDTTTLPKTYYDKDKGRSLSSLAGAGLDVRKTSDNRWEVFHAATGKSLGDVGRSHTRSGANAKADAFGKIGFDWTAPDAAEQARTWRDAQGQGIGNVLVDVAGRTGSLDAWSETDPPPAVTYAQSLMEDGVQPMAAMGALQAMGVEETLAGHLIVQALASQFPAMLEGVPVVVDTSSGVPTINGQPVADPSKITYPTYDPQRGLRLTDASVTAGCSACGGTGEQGTGHECYICDGSGTDSAEAEGRAAGETNDNPENGLLVGLDMAAGQMPVTAAKDEAPSVSGVALKAADTGRILMLQRGIWDDKDPAAGTWEFPGGKHEDGDLTSLHAGIREWQEEVGQRFPDGGYVAHTWQSPNGVYQGHVVVIPEEKAVTLHQGRDIDNPDDPDGDESEQVAWWHPDDAKKIPALREECKTSPWGEMKTAALTAQSFAEGVMAEYDRLGEQEETLPSSYDKTCVRCGRPTDAEGDQPLCGQCYYETDSGKFADLHDEPEPALPTTDGDQDDIDLFGGSGGDAESGVSDPPTLTPVDPTGAGTADQDFLTDPTPVAGRGMDMSMGLGLDDEFDMLGSRTAHLPPPDSRSWLMDGPRHEAASPSGKVDPARATAGDIAQMAKLALANFSPQEQRELIDEGDEEGVTASNLSRLDLAGTHYQALENAMAAAEDPEELFR